MPKDDKTKQSKAGNLSDEEQAIEAEDKAADKARREAEMARRKQFETDEKADAAADKERLAAARKSPIETAAPDQTLPEDL